MCTTDANINTRPDEELISRQRW